MGGHALKYLVETQQVVRINEEQLLDSLKIVNTLIQNYFKEKELKTAMPKYIGKKESFGDLDFIVGIDKYDIKLITKYLVQELHINETDASKYFFANGNILSFSLPLIKDFEFHSKEQQFLQVDLIFTSIKNFESTFNYLSNNDFSNFLGRLARNIGLKYGVNGLFVETYINGINTNNDILLTQNMNKILEILDLNKDIYHNGFQTFNEMFEYLATSRYFSPMIFDLDYRNHDAKQRDTKRDGYKKMLEFCEKYEKEIFLEYLNEDTISTLNGLLNNNKNYIHIINNLVKHDLFDNGVKNIEKIFLDDYGITFKNYPNYNTYILYLINKTNSLEEIQTYLKDNLNIDTIGNNDSLVTTIYYYNQLKRFKEYIYNINNDKLMPFHLKIENITNTLYDTFILHKHLDVQGINKEENKIKYLLEFNKFDEYQTYIKVFETNLIYKEFFNGNIISELFNVNNKELGELMKNIKSNKAIMITLYPFILEVYNNKSLSEDDKHKLVNYKIISLIEENLPQTTFLKLSNIIKNDNKENIYQKELDK